MDGYSQSASRRDWIFLSMLPGATPGFWRQWLDQHGSPLTLLDPEIAAASAISLKANTRDALLDWLQKKHHAGINQKVDQICSEVERNRIELVAWDDPHYPPLLREIPDPPLVLYTKGRADLLGRRQLAIVGSRKASPDSLRNARRLAHELTLKGLQITSGLALGVDGAAHQGALEAGGNTLAVLGTGVERIYPRQHGHLYRQIADQGCLISELPPGTAPKAGHFPRRNRIISGLSLGALVVEAGLKSGSLITANLALEQGREVFAVPGPISSPNSRGCHRLLRDGAVLVETADDVLEALALSPLQPEAPAVPAASDLPSPDLNLSDDERQVYQHTGYQVIDSDQLARNTGLPADRLMQALMMLEMAGQVEAVPGGYRRV